MTLIAVAAALLAAGLLAPSPAEARDLVFGDDFWAHWGDGKAEIATYDLEFPRYGQLRKGTAVAIFVTETFSDELRVKADPGMHPRSDEVPVMKLNLVRDFPTGIYDYNLMTSAFYALVPFRAHPAGSPMKVSFSSQEWCGHVYHQVLPAEASIRSISHSYFDGEADQDHAIGYPDGALFEDGLFHWARGLAAPALKPGETATVDMLRSLDRVRLSHVPLDWHRVELTRGGEPVEIEVPAGRFTVVEHIARVDDDPSWTFRVEPEFPHRIIAWETTDGRKAELVAVERLEYWRMNDRDSIESLDAIGLEPRPVRTP